MGTKKEKVSLQKRADQIKHNIKEINDEAIQVTENLVNASLSSGAKWQKLMAKALENGTVLFGKQQDMVLDALEEMKGQYVSGNKRFRKLIGWQPGRKKKRTSKKTAFVESIDEVMKTVRPEKVEKASAKSDDARNDLKIIEGIGPKIEGLLNQAGITTFERLAATNVKHRRKILDDAGPAYKVHNPATWKEQAKMALAGKLVKKQ